jgi:hypothetical protein
LLLFFLSLSGRLVAQSCGGTGACDPADQIDCSLEGGLWHPYPGCYCTWKSPIIINLSGEGYYLTSASGGVNFDLDADGFAERTAWTAADSNDFFLALDRNGNGKIDNGKELFGNFTEQPSSPSRNGFLALAVFDKAENGGNGDGVIDDHDVIFPHLRLWRDSNHNGISDPGELFQLSEMGVHSISLKYRLSHRTDEYGNIFRYRAKVEEGANSSTPRWAYDVVLASQ